MEAQNTAFVVGLGANPFVLCLGSPITYLVPCKGHDHLKISCRS